MSHGKSSSDPLLTAFLEQCIRNALRINFYDRSYSPHSEKDPFQILVRFVAGKNMNTRLIQMRLIQKAISPYWWCLAEVCIHNICCFQFQYYLWKLFLRTDWHFQIRFEPFQTDSAVSVQKLQKCTECGLVCDFNCFRELHTSQRVGCLCWHHLENNATYKGQSVSSEI